MAGATLPSYFAGAVAP